MKEWKLKRRRGVVGWSVTLSELVLEADGEPIVFEIKYEFLYKVSFFLFVHVGQE
jgi:hypothetical protein